MAKKEKFEVVGHIGIDAGCCWIGDPCYVLHQDKPAVDIGNNWDEFCGKIDTEGGVTAFKFLTNDMLGGVCVETGYGDGVYPVSIRRDSAGRVVEVKISFEDIEE